MAYFLVVLSVIMNWHRIKDYSTSLYTIFKKKSDNRKNALALDESKWTKLISIQKQEFCATLFTAMIIIIAYGDLL